MKNAISTRVGLHGGAVVCALLVVTLLAGCATVSTVTPTVSSAIASSFGHIHGVRIGDGSTVVYVATHEGLFRVSSSLEALQDSVSLGGPIAGLHQDNMGFAIDGERIYASRHPDPTVSADSSLGLVASADRRKSWNAVSLKGTTDFHDLKISHSRPGETTIYGFDSADTAIKVSHDAGSTWTSGAALEMRDMAADPAVASTIYATTRTGPEVSHDYAATFEIGPNAPALYLIASAGSVTQPQLVGIDVAGIVWSKSADMSRQATGQITGKADALAFSVGTTPMLIVADQRGIVASTDVGATWRILVRN